MNIDTSNLLNSILEELSSLSYVHPGDVPNIDLYMDQVTTFMDEQLASTKRYPDDKILTKTMINNYTKNNLLPPPVKKKYSREHLLLLVFIYYFKNILSIKDIETVLAPLTEKYFPDGSSFELADIYKEVCKIEKEQLDSIKENVTATYEKSAETFTHLADGEDKEILQQFAFICSLSFDVYIKKMIIELIIDDLSSKSSKNEEKKKGK